MALVFKTPDNIWRVAGKKHLNEPLEEVAKTDPKFLQWIFKDASVNLSDEAFDALEAVMLKEKIEIP